MNRIVSALLLIAFVTVNFSKVIIVAHYELNKAKITEQFCVNKDKPAMHCCGKCHLKKKLAEDDAKQKSPALPDIKNDIQLFGSPLAVHIYSEKTVALLISSPYKMFVHTKTANSVFRPPCA